MVVMAQRKRGSAWAKVFGRSFTTLARHTMHVGSQAMKQALKPAVQRRKPPPGAGDWLPGMAMGPAGARRFRLYRPPGVKLGELLPLLVMLHGCGQDARSFALCTRMNSLATRERFLVLYPEQDRLANAQGCWNWFDTSSGRAHGEAALILAAIDQVCLLYPADHQRVALAGLSAGASMAALLATRHPDRFKAVVMHSGIAPGTAHSPLSALGAMHGHRATKPLAKPRTGAATAAAWPPLMVIHGASDPVVSASNGLAAARVWAEATDAQPGPPRSVQRGQRHTMTVTDFKRSGRTRVTLVQVDRLGHAWSGGAKRQPYSDALGPDASRLVWAFAARQFRA